MNDVISLYHQQKFLNDYQMKNKEQADKIHKYI